MNYITRDYDYTLKVLLIGPTNAGKTSLLVRFADHTFDCHTYPTLSIDFRFRSLSIDDSFIKLELWDTAGQERFKSITHSYYRRAHAIILVYDASSSDSFTQLTEQWIPEIREQCPHLPLFCIANKCDTVRIDYNQREYFRQRRIDVYEVSAWTGHQVQETIINILRVLIRIVQPMRDKQINMSIQEKSIVRRRKCLC